MPQKPKTERQIRTILDNIQFQDRRFRLLRKGDGFLVQVEYEEADIDIPGSAPTLQRGRKWYVSPFSTETEIVETAFKALRISNDHVLKEHFLYKGHRVYSPHFQIEARIEMCKNKRFDRREPPGTKATKEKQPPKPVDALTDVEDSQLISVIAALVRAPKDMCGKILVEGRRGASTTFTKVLDRLEQAITDYGLLGAAFSLQKSTEPEAIRAGQHLEWHLVERDKGVAAREVKPKGQGTWLHGGDWDADCG